MCFALAFSCLCCAGTMICQKCCSCCKTCFGTNLQQQVRLSYILLTIFSLLFGIFSLYAVGEMMKWTNNWIHCPSNSGGENNCTGISSVYRMSFTLMCLYVLILIFLFCRSKISKAANEGFWTLKIFGIIVLFVCLFFVPNSFFEGYVVFSQIFGGIFLVAQSIILIDIFYLWGETWANKYKQGDSSFASVLILTSLVLYGGCITLQVYNFIWFDGCGSDLAINIVNTILIVVLVICQLLGYNQHASIISTGSFSIYMTFLNFSAQLSGDECGKILTHTGSKAAAESVELSIGMALIIVVFFYLICATKQNTARIDQKTGEVQAETVNAGMLVDQNAEDKEDQYDAIVKEEQQSEEKVEATGEQEILIVKKDDKEVKAKVLANNQIVAIAEEKQNEKIDEEALLAPYKSNVYILFHFVMLTASIYGVMMITNWGAPDFSKQFSLEIFTPSLTSYWIKIIVAWVSALLFLWTLVAPALFPNREFS